MAEWQIELMTDAHDRGAFSCGKAPLDEFLRKHAGQYARRDVGQTFVAVRPGKVAVIGYYTLAASYVEFVHLPATLGKKLPKHPVPTILLGRLAVDRAGQRKGLGRDLVADAIRRALRIAGEVGIVGVDTHAIDDEAKAFYSRFGFVPLLDQERHMFLPMATIRKGIRGTPK
jgi:GNAT superfamily N-acetyltransferase